MVDNIKPSQMNQINATTKQQVEEGKVDVLKSIASYFNDNFPTPGKKTAKGTLKSTEEAMKFKTDIDKILTENDLSGAFKKFNDKLIASGKSITDYSDATDSANSQFIKNFNKYSKERNNAERKQSILARENIATRIDENNELRVLKKSEIRMQQDEMKKLRGQIEDIEDELRRKQKKLSGEQIAAKFDEIEEKHVSDLKDPTYENLMKIAMNSSDGVIVGSENVSKKINKFLSNYKKPVLDYHSLDSFSDPYLEFYNNLIS